MSSPTNSTNENRPVKAICELFKHHHPKDPILCSMVNKRSAGFKPDRLVAVDCFDNCPNQWCHSNQTIQEEELCDLKMFVSLTGTPFSPLLLDLKQLALCGESLEFDLNELNKFSRLVNLEINIKHLNENMVSLNLPRLKVLVFQPSNRYGNDHKRKNGYYNEDTDFNLCPLEIDCPELNVLVYREQSLDQSELNVKHPKTIKWLDTNMADQKLALFKSVEHLMTS